MSAIPSTASSGRRVLLVDDDALVRLVAAELLVLAGYSVIEAEDAAAALAYLGRGNVPDILMTDVRMPGDVDGIALAGIVATRWPHVGILVCSAHARPAAEDLPAGAVFLAKPHAPGALVRHVTELALRREPTPGLARDLSPELVGAR